MFQGDFFVLIAHLNNNRHFKYFSVSQRIFDLPDTGRQIRTNQASFCVCLLSALCCLVSWPLGKVAPEWVSFLAIAGSSFFSGISVNICWQLGSELYPTIGENHNKINWKFQIIFSGRGTGAALILFTAAIVNFLVQYVILSAKIWAPLPKLILGLFTLLGGFVALFLPETKGLPLPDDVKQAESQGNVSWTTFRENLRQFVPIQSAHLSLKVWQPALWSNMRNFTTLQQFYWFY